MFEHRLPVNELKKYVRTYLHVTDENRFGKYIIPAMPRTAIFFRLDGDLIIRPILDDSFVPEAAAVRGIIENPCFFEYPSGKNTSMAIEFHPTGLFALTGANLSDFRNMFSPLKNYFPKEEINELLDHLKALNRVDDKCDTVSEWLIQKFKTSAFTEHNAYLIVRKACAIAAEREYRISAKELAFETGVTYKSLLRYFEKVVGCSPKKFLELNLFEQIILSVRSGKMNIGDFITQPFEDYSHINKWFQKFAANSPSDFNENELHVIKNVLNIKTE